MGSDWAPARPTDQIERGESPAVGAMATKVAVLLVDDEVLVRDVLQAALEEGGYLVVAADSGRTAVALLEAHDGNCRVLVTDIELGRGPTGWDVARRAREIDPGMAVIYMSAAGLHEHGAKGVSNSAVLNKPFDADQMLAEIAGLTEA